LRSCCCRDTRIGADHSSFAELAHGCDPQLGGRFVYVVYSTRRLRAAAWTPGYSRRCCVEGKIEAFDNYQRSSERCRMGRISDGAARGVVRLGFIAVEKSPFHKLTGHPIKKLS
jgi:hypothetical protein